MSTEKKQLLATTRRTSQNTTVWNLWSSLAATCGRCNLWLLPQPVWAIWVVILKPVPIDLGVCMCLLVLLPFVSLFVGWLVWLRNSLVCFFLVLCDFICLFYIHWCPSMCFYIFVLLSLLLMLICLVVLAVDPVLVVSSCCCPYLVVALILLLVVAAAVVVGAVVVVAVVVIGVSCQWLHCESWPGWDRFGGRWSDIEKKWKINHIL